MTQSYYEEVDGKIQRYSEQSADEVVNSGSLAPTTLTVADIVLIDKLFTFIALRPTLRG